MPITAKQTAKRKDYIGGSDAAVIMGYGPTKADGTPYKTSYDIWAEKTGKLSEQKSTAAMDAGNAFERGIISLAIRAGIIGKVIHNQFRVLKGTHCGANLDAIEIQTGHDVEAKLRHNAGEDKPIEYKWGEPNTDHVPRDVIIQATFQMRCAGTDAAKIIAVLASRGWKVQPYFVDYNKEIGDWIIEGCENFWEKYIKTDTSPPNILPSPETIRRFIRVPKKTISIPNGAELVRARENANETYAAAKAVKEAADLALKAALGDAEQGNFDGGYVSYFQYLRKAETKIRETYDYRSIKVVMDK